MFIGVMGAALMALYLGYKWEAIEKSMMDGIYKALQSVCILVIVGILIGVWINAGVVPTMIFYGLKVLKPAIFFIASVLICSITSLATGTSWGTIGIMVPLVCAVFDWTDQSTLLSIGLAASCAGGVCGDHLSPISDTTIMASAGAHCFHLNHVATQIPYGVTVAAVSFVSFIIAGLVQNVVVCMIIAVALMIGTLLVIRAIVAKKHTGIFQEMANADKAMAK